MSATRGLYDECHTQLKVRDSVSPLEYMLYQGAHESCTRCRSAPNKGDVSLIDAESELLGITRFASRCPQFKFSPKCDVKGVKCIPTGKLPVELEPSVCMTDLNPMTPYYPARTTDNGINIPYEVACSKF